MFRSEWACSTRPDREWSGLKGYGAGQPHWHFDALDSIPKQQRRDRDILSGLRAAGESKAREFEPQADVDVQEFVTGQKVSRVHFASAAAWWKPPPHGHHMHTPGKLADIETWVRHSLDYIKLELGRL